MCFPQYDFALMVFHFYLLGTSHVHGFGNLFFFLGTCVSIMLLLWMISVSKNLNVLISIVLLEDGISLTHHVTYQWYFFGGKYICHPRIICKILVRLVPQHQSLFGSYEQRCQLLEIKCGWNANTEGQSTWVLWRGGAGVSGA